MSTLCLNDCDWFPAFRDHAPASAAVHRLLKTADEPIEVGYAHGDLGPGNMLEIDATGPLLFDWENASSQAPVMTDSAGLWLALHQREVLRSPAGMQSEFRAQWASVSESVLLAALAFLCAHDNLAAARLLEEWK